MSDTKATQESFAARFKRLRREKGLSQTKLAQLAEVHYTHIGRYEKGISRPQADTLIRLADALGVAPTYLLEGAIEEYAADMLSDRDLLKQFQQLEKLPENDKAIVKRLIQAFLVQSKMQEMVAG